jgi:exodeoxyribonuclease VII small subunit
MPNKNEKIDFDKSLAEVEKIVLQLESGNMSLEKSLEAFEKGVNLTKKCQSVLNEAEQKVKLLTSKHGKVVSSPFEAHED